MFRKSLNSPQKLECGIEPRYIEDVDVSLSQTKCVPQRQNKIQKARRQRSVSSSSSGPHSEFAFQILHYVAKGIRLEQNKHLLCATDRVVTSAWFSELLQLCRRFGCVGR